MEQTEKLLQSIVENARMGISACEQLLKKADENEIRQEIMLEKQHYSSIARRGEQLMYENGAEPKPEGMMQRMGMWMGMQMNTISDHSSAHLADMLIQGATMGIVEMTKARNSNPDASGQAKQIAADFITGQQEAVDRLKSFLLQKA